MKIKIFILLLTVLKSYSPTVPAQGLQFYREDIVFSLRNNSMETNAVYQFCNVGEKDITTPLFYPFPGNTMELIDSIVVKNDKTGDVIAFRSAKSGISFEISVKSYSQASYCVFFRQKLVEKNFIYILKSTETWQRALEFANFELQVPVDIKVDSLSYQPDTSYINNDLQYYIWKKKDFMPEKDFEVSFMLPKPKL
jgi:hypothetical protein